jgi:hypothetical protein
VRKGRNVRDGYSRGVGLQFGTLGDAVGRDPLYAEALSLAQGRTIVAEHNRMNLFLIVRAFLDRIPGDVIEFGSYKGGNAIFLASVLKKLHPGRRVWSLDTFSGMPETDATVDAHRRGDFQDVDLDELRRFAQGRASTTSSSSAASSRTRPKGCWPGRARSRSRISTATSILLSRIPTTW